MKNDRTLRLEMLHTRGERIDRHVLRLGGIERRFVLLRLIEAIAGAVLVFIAFQLEPGWIGWVALGLSLGVFGFTVIRHNRLLRRIQEWNILRQYVSTQVARMNLDWKRIPLSQADRFSDLHPFERDLNLVGERSLHHLLDTTTSEGGSQRLRQWLLNLDPDPAAIHYRQAAVQELLPLTGFRSTLALTGDTVFGSQTEKFDGDQLIHWLESQGVQRRLLRLLVFLGLFALANLILFVLNAISVLPPVWIPTLIVYALVYQSNYQKFREVFSSANQLEGMLNKFRLLLVFLETYRYPPGSLLAELCQPFATPRHRPSDTLRGVSRVVSATSLKYNAPLWLFLNLLVPWDLFFAYRLEGHKQALREKLPVWLDIWYELEALHALANFAFLNPGYCFPDIIAQADVKSPICAAQDLGHPLISYPERVTNPFTLQEVGELALITGSNMSGKSTFLRTVGINLCLAFAGAPVAASALHTIPFRLFTCINVSDSLANGISYFYAEVRQLKQLLLELEKDHPTPVFFLIDEIFRGTNNRERQIGSRAFVKALTGGHGTGLISTHDLELVYLADDMPGISLYHFRETVSQDRMVFEYRLRSGPSQTTNALKIMELEGLPVE